MNIIIIKTKVHAETKRNLHTHNVKAPVSKKLYEVSGYGNSTIGDANDLWKVEIVKDHYDPKSHSVHALLTNFRLRHVQTGCLLQSSGASYPEWGFKQSEVVCDVHGNNHAAKNIWNVESHWNDLCKQYIYKKIYIYIYIFFFIFLFFFFFFFYFFFFF